MNPGAGWRTWWSPAFIAATQCLWLGGMELIFFFFLTRESLTNVQTGIAPKWKKTKMDIWKNISQYIIIPILYDIPDTSRNIANRIGEILKMLRQTSLCFRHIASVFTTTRFAVFRPMLALFMVNYLVASLGNYKIWNYFGSLCRSVNIQKGWKHIYSTKREPISDSVINGLGQVWLESDTE